MLKALSTVTPRGASADERFNVEQPVD